MRIVAVLRDATLRAFVATRAEIHVEHEDAPAFVEALFDVIRHQWIDISIAEKTE